MLDIDIDIAKKNIETKKHLCIVNILKKSVRATTITKCILDLVINLIISKLLAFIPAIEKQLLKTLFKDKVV